MSTQRRHAFGPFWLYRMLGRGGMSEVFIAQRRGEETLEPVVLKRLRPELVGDAEYLQRLRFEATVASRLAHPNLVRMLEFGRVGDCHYIVMEHVKGFSLKRVLDEAMERDLPPPPSVALAIGCGILSGLTAMHGATDDHGQPRPILHRDVTPGNVILDHTGRAVLIDFGISKDIFGPSITRVGRIVGTARYMSPEHRLGQFADPRTDVFSASIILFELITARHPWPPMPPKKELLRTVFDPPEITAEIVKRVPADVLPILIRGLDNDPENRFRDSAAMLSALEETETLRRIRSTAVSLGDEVLSWVRQMGISADEALEDMVIDSNSSAPQEAGSVVWNPKGELSRHNTLPPEMLRTSDLPPAKHVTIPPLGPRMRREKTTELEFAAEVGQFRQLRSFRRLALILLVIIGLVLAALILGLQR